MPAKDMATATNAIVFIRSASCPSVPCWAVLAMGEAIIASVLPRKLAAIPNVASLGNGNGIAVFNDNVGRVHLIADVALRHAVLHAWARSIATVWMYPVHRNMVCSDAVKNAGDSENTLTEDVQA
ncbi:hypothetical protein EV363DRAFT_1436619 [Boletus edulis]|nr:hypothetical protein EV363DRAFT_1436619 [Boletus edulis]